MAIQFASGALKSRDTPQSQWEDAIVAVRVNDVAVQDTTPTGTEHIWVDTDDPGEVVVPTIEDHNVLANAIGIVVDGNKSALGATTGQYVILQNSTITGKDDGLYTAAQTIPANTVIDGTYLTAVSGGGLNDLNTNVGAIFAEREKIYRLNVTSGEVATNGYCSFSASYLADNFVYVSNSNEICFSEAANVLVIATVIGSCQGSDPKRMWIAMSGGNTANESIAYGNYATCRITALYAVDSTTKLKIQNKDAKFNVGGGNISGSQVLIIRIK